MSSIKEKGEQIVEEFSQYDEWIDKYNYLIELGKTLPVIDEEYRTKQYVISGCQSQVWLQAKMEDGKVTFKADSDAAIPKGIAAILVRVLSGETPESIAHTDLDFIEKIGLNEHLSPTRSNGLLSMMKQMKLYGLAFQVKSKK